MAKGAPVKKTAKAVKATATGGKKKRAARRTEVRARPEPTSRRCMFCCALMFVTHPSHQYVVF